MQQQQYPFPSFPSFPDKTAMLGDLQQMVVRLWPELYQFAPPTSFLAVLQQQEEKPVLVTVGTCVPTLTELWKYRDGDQFELSKTPLPADVVAVIVVSNDGMNTMVNEKMEEEKFLRLLRSLEA